MTLSVQFMTIASMIAGGVYLGAALDLYRRFSERIKKRVLFIYSAELIFWLSQTVLLFYVLYNVNHGEIRVYVYIACFLGFSLYQALFKQSFQAVLDICFRVGAVILQFVRQLLRILFYEPFLGMLRIVIALVVGTLQLIGLIFVAIGRIGLAIVRFFLRGFYFLLPKPLREIVHILSKKYSTIKGRWKRMWQWIKTRGGRR